MTCRELNDLLDDHRTGDLAPGVPRAFEDHLRGCPLCVAYLRSYEEAVRWAKEAWRGPEGRPVSADAPPDLVAAVLSTLPGSPTGRPPGR